MDNLRRRRLPTGIVAAWSLSIAIVHAQQPPAGYQVPTTSIPSAQLVPGFESAQIGDKSLRYTCQGNGAPTVLIEQGAGISVETVFSFSRPVGWAYIAPKIAKTTRICVYDRAGLGHSSALTNSRSSMDAAHDLHALLGTIKIPPPYVLAGQSLGGINARAFASEYPSEVVGMVLIDSSSPDQQRRFEKVLPPRSADESALLQGFRDGPDRAMQGGEWYDFKANEAIGSTFKSLGSTPLIVLTRSPGWRPQPPLVPKEWDDAVAPVWQELQTELAKLSTNSKHIVAKKAGHNIQAEEPELVIDAILNLVKQARAR